MEWVEAFYSRQHDWLREYKTEVTERHRKIAAGIARLGSGPPERVLELGAGGGQVAAATADLGYEVTAVELVGAAASHARKLAARPRSGTLTVVQGDFYEIELAGGFDAVTYWDGFGIGSDEDQRRLLRRVAGWLRPGGGALFDIYTPWGAARLAGREQRHGEAVRRYAFDAEGCRMIDSWWPIADEAAMVSQSLRCYSPADLHLLLEGTGLRLEHTEPGGGFDRSGQSWLPSAPLELSLTYLAVLVPITS